MHCKDYYALFQEKAEIILTSVKSWSKKYPNVADKWKELFHNISHLSIDNKLKQFSFKLLHRILVTKKELKRFKIAPNDECFFCKRPDSLEHAFLEYSAANYYFFCECLLWFNNEHHTDFSLPSQQLLLKDYNLPPETNPILSRKFDIFVVSSQKYFYSCKMIEMIFYGNCHIQFLSQVHMNSQGFYVDYLKLKLVILKIETFDYGK